MKLNPLPAGEAKRAVGILARQVVHGQVLGGGQLAAGDLAADHEHVMLADASFGAVLAGVAVFLLITAVELDQVLVAVVEVVGVADQSQGDGPAQVLAGLLGSLRAGAFVGRLSERMRRGNLRFIRHG